MTRRRIVVRVTAPSHRPTDQAVGDDADRPLPHRRVFVATESIVALGGAVGTWQLLSGTGTPPVSDLEPLGLSSWVLPGMWLFATTTTPASIAAWLAWRRSPLAPTAVLVASCTLAVEIAVQIPFIGPSPLQPVFGTAAAVLAVLALRARASRAWFPETTAALSTADAGS